MRLPGLTQGVQPTSRPRQSRPAARAAARWAAQVSLQLPAPPCSFQLLTVPAPNSRRPAAGATSSYCCCPRLAATAAAVNRRDGGLLSDILIVLLRVACAEPYCSSALAEAGAATALLEVLRQRQLPVPIHASATLTLQALSGCSEAACAAISQGGGAAVIVEALRGTLSGVGSSGSSMAGSAIDDELQLGAAATLMHLSDWPEGVTAVLAAGGVPVLVRCLAQGNTEAQEPAVEALLGLMLQRQDQLPAFAAAGGIPAALRVLHGSGDLAVSLPAARLLALSATERQRCEKLCGQPEGCRPCSACCRAAAMPMCRRRLALRSIV